MNSERMQPLLDTWFRDRDEAARDPSGDIARVMADVPRTRQQRRWLPFPLFRRKTHTATATDTADYRPSAVPATNGHAPTVIGRTHTMFSPVKAITVGALVFAFGGVLLIAQPFDQQGSVPGAEQAAEPVPPVEVTITQSGDGTDLDPEACTTRSDDPSAIVDVDASACIRAESFPLSASDPRLSGMATEWVTEYYWPGTGWIFEAYAIEIVNDEGAWVGTGRYVGGSLDRFGGYTLTGEGAYEGLAAVVTEDPSAADEEDTWNLRAVIVDGGLPPFPEPIE